MFIDAHAHLGRYEKDLQSALAEIDEHDIFTISNSMDLPSYRRNVEIGEMSKLVLPTFGVHPWNAPQYADHLEELRDTIEESPMLGEIGLDYHFVEDVSRYPTQAKVFEFFLTAAKDQEKIVNLHTKGAETEVLNLLKQYNIQRAIIHWYSGPLDVLNELAVQGVYFTIGVEVLHSDHIKTIAQELPLGQLLTETDNPGGRQWLTGTPGMPHQIRDVVRTIAKLRQTPAEVVTQTIQTNFARLIQGDPWLANVYTDIFEKL